MQHQFGKTIVIDLGGSIVHPERIDVQFLKKFKVFFRRFLQKKIRFVIVVGGGKLSRNFQSAASKITAVVDEDKDWLGVHATRLNAHLVRTVFRKEADPVVIDSRHRLSRLRHQVTIAAGWRPGWSTDYVAVMLAADFGASEVILAGKPAFVYDRDNAIHAGAKPIRSLSWRAYRRLIPQKWIPGIHAPVDPVAAQLAEKKGIAGIVIDGRNLRNFGNLLNGKEFRGTVIR